jgi:succinyl-CoA synthetase beta subunit
MKLYEFEGKELFKKYGIPVPDGVLLANKTDAIGLAAPFILKAQVKFGDRKKYGGILFPKNKSEAARDMKNLHGAILKGEKVEKVLAEEIVKGTLAEYYVSFSYDTATRGPVLALSPIGGSGIHKAIITPIDLNQGLPAFAIREALKRAKFPSADSAGMAGMIQKLWKLFIEEYALLAEINPIFKLPEGGFLAGDAKVILDDEKINPNERRFVEMGGDIAILASGGGASMINIDALLALGGKPANYTEYSGNPKAETVRELTVRVLSRPGLRGCWVVGGIANFTDIYETMCGFLEGLRQVKPEFPIVIRRDGPRQKEAFEMLREARDKEKLNIHIFGSEVSMGASAKEMVRLARAYRPHSKNPTP